MSSNLLLALGEADANIYLCSNEQRAGKVKFASSSTYFYFISKRRIFEKGCNCRQVLVVHM